MRLNYPFFFIFFLFFINSTYSYSADCEKPIMPSDAEWNSWIQDIKEEAYTEFIKDFENTYFKEVYDILSKKFKLGRVRILVKEPRSTLSWHRDPEPRLHIPIITNPGSIMVIENIAKHLPADGSVWITNNTKYHNAFNGGEESRVHLVACVLNYNFN